MKKYQVTAISIAFGLVFSAGAMAEAVTKDAYKAGEARIADEYTADKAKCDGLSGNAKDICFAEAKGKEKVAGATLEARYEPTAEHRYDVLVAKAKADYAVANEKCDDLDGNAQEVCVKQAKAAETAVRADAEAKLKTWEAKQDATDKTNAAQTKAGEQGAAARQDAAEQMRDADYALAKAKCDALETAESLRCAQEAKTKYGM